MKKQAINFSWPAKLLDFAKDEKQENFSRGKLQVFYKGETADHRFFSDAFSEELVKSLPYTPVVSYYDEDKQDFVGHATEQQILGIVDPCSEPSFEEDEEGKTWCVCDVVLYTERPDSTGELAKKIVGHPQSLELDPSSVQYKINYDEKKHFKNIEFTAGKFVGVSVLGNDQKPAFTGSAFFDYDEQFEAKMQLLRKYCETKYDQKNGGQKMNLNEFIKLSWGDISVKVNDAITTEYENDAYTYVIDMFEDYAIARFYYYLENNSKLMKVYYSCDENGNIILGNANEVHVVYEDIPEPVAVSTQATVTETADLGVENNTEEVQVTEESTSDTFVKDEVDADEESDPVNEEKEENSVESFEKEETSDTTTETETQIVVEASTSEETETNDVAENSVENAESKPEEFTEEQDPANVSNAEVTESERVENNEEISEEENSGSTSFTESERAEFEALKREKKVRLVDSYKDVLSEEEYKNFIDLANNFETSEEKLELELLRAYKNSETNKEKPIRAFAFAPVVSENKSESALDAFVRKNKNI